MTSNSNKQSPNHLGRVRVDFPVNLVGVLVAISALIIVLFALVKNERARNVYVFGTAVCTAAATGVSSYYLLQSILRSAEISQEGQNQAERLHQKDLQQTLDLHRKDLQQAQLFHQESIEQAQVLHTEITERTLAFHHERKETLLKEKSLDYISRWNSTDCSVAREIGQEVKTLLKNAKHIEHVSIIRTFLTENPKKELLIAFALNFFEELALALENQMVDEELSKSFFKGIFVEYYEILDVYIAERRRDKKNDDLYKKFTDLTIRWRNGGNSKGRI